MLGSLRSSVWPTTSIVRSSKALLDILSRLEVRLQSCYSWQQKHDHAQSLAEPPDILLVILKSAKLIRILWPCEFLREYQDSGQYSEENLNNKRDCRVEKEVVYALKAEPRWRKRSKREALLLLCRVCKSTYKGL